MSKQPYLVQVFDSLDSGWYLYKAFSSLGSAKDLVAQLNQDPVFSEKSIQLVKLVA